MRTQTKDLRGDDVFDSRDAAARLDELEGERDSARLPDEGEDGDNAWTSEGGARFTDDWTEDQEQEFQALVALRDEYSGSEGWRDGAGFIRDSYFEHYAREMAEDIGAISGNEGWPLNCIDWEKACEELKYDYSSVDFDGVEYWYRS